MNPPMREWPQASPPFSFRLRHDFLERTEEVDFYFMS